MKAMKPDIEVPGDNKKQIGFIRPNIMHRNGECLAMTDKLAVWRFGARPESEFAKAYGVSLPENYIGFLWVLATRKAAVIKEVFEGFAIELPASFRKVLDE